MDVGSEKSAPSTAMTGSAAGIGSADWVLIYNDAVGPPPQSYTLDSTTLDMQPDQSILDGFGSEICAVGMGRRFFWSSGLLCDS
jgi:hypothetical protein